MSENEILTDILEWRVSDIREQLKRNKMGMQSEADPSGNQKSNIR